MLPILESDTTPRAARDPRPVTHGRCGACAAGTQLGFEFSYAYQPIIDLERREIFAHEALVRGAGGESAATVLARVTEENRYGFDQACRVRAIEVASRLQMTSRLSINFLPNAVYRPEVCIRTTLEAARQHAFPIEHIIFETVEGERIEDGKWYAEVLREYQRMGFLTAIDDFGAGYAGLTLLADFQPDIIKLDMALVRGIDTRRAAQQIVRAIVDVSTSLRIAVVAEGIETRDELLCLEALGIRLVQGYFIGRPRFEATTAATELPWDALKSSDTPSALPADDVFGGVQLR